MRTDYFIDNGEYVRIFNLQIPLAHHCNNACLGCSTFSALLDPYFVPKENIARDLTGLMRVARAGQVTLIGGEPLLHPDLLSIIDIVTASRKGNPGDSVTNIVTNGQLLDRMPDAFWQKIDRVIVSKYPGKIKPEQMDIINSKSAQFGKPVFAHGPDFGLPLTKNKLSRENAEKAWGNCSSIGHCTTLIGGKLYLCHEFYYHWLLGLCQNNNGIDVESITREALMKYALPTEPAEACYRCTGFLNRTLSWRECRNREEWLRLSMADKI